MTEKKIQKKEISDVTKKKEISQDNETDIKDNEVRTKKLDPTRYGDWEVNGIAVDF
ncbi:MAG: hypothetical protein CFH01_00382 [Alphaproteobacteria bacterium MarineAlpha2_Bin1]|nr:MAG: hypothetical protein CFH01_00382 [Alphaproteobacteria bacterium MarineAlpha2_Bin1]|tara:strand:- start:1594 stop:1761 length:168 start_codon:yes stop_codon:yes gene_type:complete